MRQRGSSSSQECHNGERVGDGQGFPGGEAKLAVLDLLRQEKKRSLQWKVKGSKVAEESWNDSPEMGDKRM